tara:strand:+ start:47 stop:223 length:177 start_codon:yes stop_codon:yes gene_type:complete
MKLTYQRKKKKKNIVKICIYNFLSSVNFRWQNFIEEMFGMGNFSCPSYKEETKKSINK